MTLPSLNRELSRELDTRAIRDFGMSGLVLMENAGRGTADVLCGLGIGGPVVICCGRGNNAGDGFVLARHLDLRGHPVVVLLFAEPETLSGDAATNYRILRKTGIRIELFGSLSTPLEPDWPFDTANWLVDGLLGTGATGEPRPPLDVVIKRMNKAKAPILALDLPSGLDCDTGVAAKHTIRAAHTCTFATAKPGLLLPDAQPYVGRLHVLDIGAPRVLIETLLDEAQET
ncbi:MAG: NAD(P)H-hydrate epimerase [Pirellulales bacterium]|nr:NAD(P)H-hydrate epimerase [Pirellulales bacterium]